MVTAGELLRIYSFRLKMNDEGKTQWPPAQRIAVEAFVEKLKSVSPSEAVAIDADIDRDPLARFVSVATGKLLGEIPAPVGDGSSAVDD